MRYPKKHSSPGWKARARTNANVDVDAIGRSQSGSNPPLAPRQRTINSRAVRLFGDRRPLTKEREIRHALPYGVWLCRDGRQVLFDRDYCAIWERPGIGHHGTKADSYEWVHWVRQGWFFDDGTSPLSRFTPTAMRQQSLKLIDDVLRAWGLKRAADNRSVARIVS